MAKGYRWMASGYSDIPINDFSFDKSYNYIKELGSLDSDFFCTN